VLHLYISSILLSALLHSEGSIRNIHLKTSLLRDVEKGMTNGKLTQAIMANVHIAVERSHGWPNSKNPFANTERCRKPEADPLQATSSLAQRICQLPHQRNILPTTELRQRQPEESRELLQLRIWKIDGHDGVRTSRSWGS
jgi:hypothetical protein